MTLTYLTSYYRYTRLYQYTYYIMVYHNTRHERNLLPTSTMVMEKDPDKWYRKFSRNIHGLRRDKPYSNLQWPPAAQ